MGRQTVEKAIESLHEKKVTRLNYVSKSGCY
jgi:hypothetical protein